MINRKYSVVQGLNKLIVDQINYKERSLFQNMKKIQDKNDFIIESMINKKVVYPNVINVKNPSMTQILFFGETASTSREKYLFRVFPGEEVNYFLHEQKPLYVYVTYLSSSLEFDINYFYSDNYNPVLNNYIDSMQKKYECLVLFSGKSIASGSTTEETEIIYNTSWAKHWIAKLNMDKTYNFSLYKYDGFKNVGSGDSIYSGASATSGYRNVSVYGSAISNMGYGFKFGVTNTDGVDPASCSLTIELFE